MVNSHKVKVYMERNWTQTSNIYGIHYVKTRTIYMKSVEINSVSYRVQIRSIGYLSQIGC